MLAACLMFPFAGLSTLLCFRLLLTGCIPRVIIKKVKTVGTARLVQLVASASRRLKTPARPFYIPSRTTFALRSLGPYRAH